MDQNKANETLFIFEIDVGGLRSTKTWNYNGCVKKNVQKLILSFCLSLNFIKDTRYRIVLKERSL